MTRSVRVYIYIYIYMYIYIIYIYLRIRVKTAFPASCKNPKDWGKTSNKLTVFKIMWPWPCSRSCDCDRVQDHVTVTVFKIMWPWLCSRSCDRDSVQDHVTVVIVVTDWRSCESQCDRVTDWRSCESKCDRVSDWRSCESQCDRVQVTFVYCDSAYTVTVNVFNCPKNKRPRGLPPGIRLL